MHRMNWLVAVSKKTVHMEKSHSESSDLHLRLVKNVRYFCNLCPVFVFFEDQNDA